MNNFSCISYRGLGVVAVVEGVLVLSSCVAHDEGDRAAFCLGKRCLYNLNSFENASIVARGIHIYIP